MADPTDIVLRPTTASRVRVTTAGALLRIDAVMIRDDDRPLPPDIRTIAEAIRQHADRLEAEERPAMTIFECRCCSASTGEWPCDSLPEGWGRIERIDGPDAICPSCIADPTALDDLHEFGYPHAAVRPVAGQERI